MFCTWNSHDIVNQLCLNKTNKQKIIGASLTLLANPPYPILANPPTQYLLQISNPSIIPKGKPYPDLKYHRLVSPFFWTFYKWNHSMHSCVCLHPLYIMYDRFINIILCSCIIHVLFIIVEYYSIWIYIYLSITLLMDIELFAVCVHYK